MKRTHSRILLYHLFLYVFPVYITCIVSLPLKRRKDPSNAYPKHIFSSSRYCSLGSQVEWNKNYASFWGDVKVEDMALHKKDSRVFFYFYFHFHFHFCSCFQMKLIIMVAASADRHILPFATTIFIFYPHHHSFFFLSCLRP